MVEAWTASHIGRFRVDGVLGRGGMGVVLRAFDPQLQRAVAIKLLDAPPRASLEGATVDLRADGGAGDLLSEARVLAQINHPNVLAVHEIGNERGQEYLVMELVDGVDVERWLEAASRSLAEVYRVFAAAGHGLAAVHARGIVHRDFKPANVLISPDDRVRVCDFGISAFAQHRDLVRVGAAGTPRYTAPEVWKAQPATIRSDVYSFAVALTRAITGSLITKPENADRELASRKVDGKVRAAVVRALDPDPDRRQASLGELVATFAPDQRTVARWKLVAAAGVTAGVVALGAVLLVATRGDDGSAACGNTGALLAARWNDTERARVRTATTALAPDGAAGEVDEIVARVDRYAQDWARLRGKTCTDAVPAAQRAARLACFERRLFEISGTVRALQLAPSWARAQGRSTALPDLGACIEATAVRLPAGAATRAAVEQLTARVMQLQDRGFAVLGSEGDQAALEDADRQAQALGDFELVVRIRLMRGALLRNADKMREAVKRDDDAYEMAVRYHYDNWAVVALVDAADLATLLADLTGAHTKLRAARGLVENTPSATVWARLKVYSGLAENAIDLEEFAEAADALDQAQKTVDRMEPRDPLRAVQVAMLRIRLLSAQNKLDDGLALARTTRAEAEALGDQGVPDTARILSFITDMELRRGDREQALAATQARIALLDKSLPEGHVDRVRAQSDLASSLIEVERYADAIDTLEHLIDRAKATPSLADEQQLFHYQLSRAYQLNGDAKAAMVHAQSAVDLARKQFGPHAVEVGYDELALATLELEAGAGAGDRAATHLRLAEDALAHLAADHQARIDLVELQTDLLLAKRDARAADQLASQTIALLSERKIDDARAEPLWLHGAAARTMAGDHQAALELAQRALASRTARHAKPAELAAAEAEVAMARYGLGERTPAVTVLRRVEPILRGPTSRIMYARLRVWLRANSVRL